MSVGQEVVITLNVVTGQSTMVAAIAQRMRSNNLEAEKQVGDEYE